jgi:GntR family histidine utilization transcriptional repressor
MVTGWRGELSLEGTGPLYRRIREALAEPIREGVWAPGQRIPPEEELAAHFGAARMTVHRAVRELADEGLVVRRRGAGSFVAAPPSPSALLAIVDMSRAIPAQGRRYRYTCLSQEVRAAGAEEAERLDVPVGTELRHLRCLHRADGEVVELEERWINLAVLPEARERDFGREPPGRWLLGAVPWSEAEHTVRAVNADAELAARLEMAEGEACLVLERRTFQGDAVVTWARLIHPGDRHHLTERFEPPEA